MQRNVKWPRGSGPETTVHAKSDYAKKSFIQICIANIKCMSTFILLSFDPFQYLAIQF